MLSTGYPGDSDPALEEPEWDCPECEGIVVPNGKGCAKCLDCGQEWEDDGEPPDLDP